MVLVSSHNPINVRGLSAFMDQAWPLVRQQVPDARFRLAGKICEVMAHDWPELERLGYIERLDAAYERGHVVVNPVLEGTGLPTKSVEAMLHGKALVTTLSGARGIGDGAGTAFLTGENPRELAACVIRLLVDEEARKQLAAAGLRYAEGYNERQVRSLATVISTAGARTEVAAE